MKILAKLLARRAHMPVTNSQQIQNCPRHAMKVQAGKCPFACSQQQLLGPDHWMEKSKADLFFFLNKRKFNEDARYTICLFVHKHLKLVILNKNNLFFFFAGFCFVTQHLHAPIKLRACIECFEKQWLFSISSGHEPG